ncbi:MAG: hypothetical protein IJB31_02620 [Akkermansia sp.]|nr:hypothetical protein [Akkermansia sp.]
MSRSPSACQMRCSFRLCVTTAHASPHRRKADGCGGEDFTDGGHGHHRLSDFYVLFNPYSNGDT